MRESLITIQNLQLGPTKMLSCETIQDSRFMISQVWIHNHFDPRHRQRRLLPAGLCPFLGGIGAVDHGGEGEARASCRVGHRSTQVADGGPQEGSPTRWRRARLVVVDYYSFLLVILESGTCMPSFILKCATKKDVYSGVANGILGSPASPKIGTHYHMVCWQILEWLN